MKISDIDAAPWTPPPPPPLAGPYAVNSALAHVQRWEIEEGAGPEDVVVDGDGCAWGGLADGRVMRFPAGGGAPEVMARTGGRPLGMELDADGSLVVCDAMRGLLRIHTDRQVELLADSHDGEPLVFINNAAIGSDGTVYFSVSSRRFGVHEYRSEILEHRGNGRLLAFDPSTGTTQLLLDGLYFANGVALSPDEDFLLVAETGRYRIRRYWLRGERAGDDELFVDNLPGSPDNLSTGEDGVFWLAIFTTRNPQLDFLLPRPRLRTAVSVVPEKLQPQPERHGFVLGFDDDGEVVANLQDPAGTYAPITGVREHDGWLYLGGLTESALGRVRL
jgi:sugar lactone lactonase YvrE